MRLFSDLPCPTGRRAKAVGLRRTPFATDGRALPVPSCNPRETTTIMDTAIRPAVPPDTLPGLPIETDRSPWCPSRRRICPVP